MLSLRQRNRKLDKDQHTQGEEKLQQWASPGLWRRNVGFHNRSSQEPLQKASFLAHLVSAAVNDQALKTILLVMFPFKWWKTGLSKEVAEFFWLKTHSNERKGGRGKDERTGRHKGKRLELISRKWGAGEWKALGTCGGRQFRAARNARGMEAGFVTEGWKMTTPSPCQQLAEWPWQGDLCRNWKGKVSVLEMAGTADDRDKSSGLKIVGVIESLQMEWLRPSRLPLPGHWLQAPSQPQTGGSFLPREREWPQGKDPHMLPSLCPSAPYTNVTHRTSNQFIYATVLNINRQPRIINHWRKFPTLPGNLPSPLWKWPI